MGRSLKSKHITGLIALSLSLCMLVSDASAFETLIVEEHETEPAYADGIFDGLNSDFESSQVTDVVDETGKPIFNILEILPSERMGVMGYMISGLEPVADTLETTISYTKSNGTNVTENIVVSSETMRAACMDALVNRTPGSNNDNANTHNSPDDVIWMMQELNNSLSEGNSAPFKFDVQDAGKSTGYYKYVGTGKGYYSLASRNGSNVVMVSKFHSTGVNNSGKNDYIWIEGSAGFTEDSNDIFVTDQKRVRYTNNDKFFKDFYPVANISEWKNTHKVEVTTRTPKSTTEADVERADLIIINNAGTQMRYHPLALGIYNTINNRPITEERGNIFFEGNDFTSFEIAVKIYERVVIRKDVAIVGEKNTTKLYKVQKSNGTYVTENADWSINNRNISYRKYKLDREEIETNVAKLMRMLFFVNKGGVQFAGREMFMDFMKRYVDQPGAKYTELREKYTDKRYIAPSLRNAPGNYMHYHVQGLHPGHPLVAYKHMAITGGSYNSSGVLEPVYAEENDNPPTIDARRPDELFKTAGLSYNWVYDGNGWNYSRMMWESMSSTTDYVYIDNNGTLIRDNKYSGVKLNSQGQEVFTGYWYEMDDDYGISRKCFKPISWEYAEYKEWPWTIKNADDINGNDKSGCLKEWFYDKESTGINGGKYKGNLHLMFDYFAWGDHAAVHDPQEGSFANQSLVQENSLFKQQWIKKALNGRPETNRRENQRDPEHMEFSTQKHYFSANILNGDGGNIVSRTNKVLYYNNYEVDKIAEKEATAKAYIPLYVRIQTTIPIYQIELYNADDPDHPFATYSKSGSNALGPGDLTYSISRSFSPAAPSPGTLKLENKTEYKSVGIPKELVVGDDKFNPYEYTAKLEDMLYNNKTYKTGGVNTIVIRVTLDGKDRTGDRVYVEDKVNIVRRDFYSLK